MYKFLAFVFLGLSLACAPSGGPVRSEQPWKNLEANALFERGEAYYKAGRYSEAIMTYKEYLDASPEFHRANDASFRIAQSLEGLGERIEAADAYRATGLTYDRCDLAPAAFLRAGELYELDGCPKDAIWCYKKSASYKHPSASQIAAQRLADLESRMAAMEPPPVRRGMSAEGLGARSATATTATLSGDPTVWMQATSQRGVPAQSTTQAGVSGLMGGMPAPGSMPAQGRPSTGTGVNPTAGDVTAPHQAPRSPGTPPSGLVPVDVRNIFFPPNAS